MQTLDEIAREPSSASRLSENDRNLLIARAAAVIAILSSKVTKTESNRASDSAILRKAKDDTLLTIADVAELLRFVPSYCYELARRGELRAMHHGKYWRVRRSDVDEFVSRHQRKTP